MVVVVVVVSVKMQVVLVAYIYICERTGITPVVLPRLAENIVRSGPL